MKEKMSLISMAGALLPQHHKRQVRLPCGFSTIAMTVSWHLNGGLGGKLKLSIKRCSRLQFRVTNIATLMTRKSILGMEFFKPSQRWIGNHQAVYLLRSK